MNATAFLNMTESKKMNLLKKVIRASNKEQKELVELHEKNKANTCCPPTNR